MAHSNHDTPAVTLTEVLDQQITVMEALRSCLEDEHRALQSRDPEQLLSTAERKNACLSEAGRIDRLCRELQAHDARAVSAAVNRQREQLDTLTRLCRDLNTANGSLIRRQKTRIEKTLQIMRGEPEQPGLYDPTGIPAGGHSVRRVLASI